MAISSLGGASASALFSDRSASRSQRAEQMLKAMDTDQNGAVSKGELSAFGAKLEANRPAAAASGPKPSSQELFSSADQNGDASLSLDELTAMLAEADTRASSGAKGPSGHGPPPGGGAGGAPPSGAGGKSASSQAGGKSASSETTEPADTNKDGTVSAAEKLIYQLTHPAADES